VSDPDLPIRALDRDVISTRLERIRERTLSLVAGLDWEVLIEQHVSILSPMVWDLGHIANFEELWLCQRIGGGSDLHADYAEMFDAVINPRPTRKDLLLPVARQLLEYMSNVRSLTLEILEKLEPQIEPGLLTDGFVYELVAEHEEQHQETLLQALQVLDNPSYVPAQRRRLPQGRSLDNEMVLIPAGACLVGSPNGGYSYDNERNAHEVDLPGFYLDTAPVSCGSFEAFVGDGGYNREELWSQEGWQWRSDSGAQAPANWQKDDGGWLARWMDRLEPLRHDLPVTHVNFWEAEAYSRWAGKRLPTEMEWEKAALWDAEKGEARPFPWGAQPPTRVRANLDQLGFGPASVGAYPQGASAYGVEQMIGDVWEWTSSNFIPFPGFEAYPYAEYSEIFFGDAYKVLRGGSWATRPAVARGTFRNWDFPIRRQIFSGFRCARSVD
jgi:iron(II)-dependent oxidoreductase